MSRRAPCGSRDSSTFDAVSASATTPIGTLTRKIQRQLSPSVSAPPTIGPIDTAAPVTAPQTPNATPRSRPRYALPSNASEAANIIAPPIPCTPRERLSISGDCATPHRSEAAEKITRPIANIRRRPSRSASEPEVSSSAASVSA